MIQPRQFVNLKALVARFLESLANCRKILIRQHLPIERSI